MKQNQYLFILLSVGIIALLLALVVPNFRANEQTGSQTTVMPTKIDETTSLTDVTFNLSPSTQTVKKGDTLVVSVQATSKKPLLAVDLHMSYDAHRLALEQAVSGDMFENPIVLANKIDNVAGTVLYSLGSTKPSKTSGVLATFTFKAIESGNNSMVTLEQSSVASLEGAQKATVTIGNQGSYTLY